MKIARPVQSSHERVANGVRFNVETVTEPKIKLLQRRNYDSVDVQKLAKSFHKEDILRNLRVEANGFAQQPEVVRSGSLMETALLAFADHYPLVLSPDDIWILISFALAKHVDLNAEALRSTFVQHQGKKVLEVRVDHFVPGQMSPESWERDVFPDFSRQIAQHIGAEKHAAIAGVFSTTTPTTKAAYEITLMAAMKNYFSYKMSTCCGIPWIELRGTEQDWIALHERAAQVCSTMMVPEFGTAWQQALLPVLDEFVAAYRGQVNHLFWQGMVKEIQHGQGSGSHTTISGWINVFYPYLNDKALNRFATKTWQSMVRSDGPEPDDFPLITSSAPVEWDYFGTLFSMHFHAGMFGIIQDPATLALRPRIGWVITHDPPMSGPERIAHLEKEIADLKAGSDQSDYRTKWWLEEAQRELAKLKSGSK